LLTAEAGSSKAAPPAITALTSVTPASKTMLLFSSRILMPEKRELPGLVPGRDRKPKMPQARNAEQWNKD
jgi:hypothetical protein